VSQELATAVAEKQKRDERQYSEYISKGMPTVAVVTRTDGGMHPSFQAAFQKPSSDGASTVRNPLVSTPGTIPAHAVPPRAPDTGVTGSAVVASAGDTGSSSNMFGGLFASSPEPSNSEGVLDRMSRFVGWKASDPAPTQSAPAQTKKSQPKTQTAATTPKASPPKATSSITATTNAGAIRPAAPKAPPTPEAKPEQPKPEPSQEAKAAVAAEPRSSSSAGALNGAQPTAPTGSFNNRWGSFQ